MIDSFKLLSPITSKVETSNKIISVYMAQSCRRVDDKPETSFLLFLLSLLVLNVLILFLVIGETSKMNKRDRSVCIVGAGAAGLVTLKNFLDYRQEFGDIVCYEQTKFVGGTWNYVEQTGTDENGLPIHSSMYKNLR